MPARRRTKKKDSKGGRPHAVVDEWIDAVGALADLARSVRDKTVDAAREIHAEAKTGERGAKVAEIARDLASIARRACEDVDARIREGWQAVRDVDATDGASEPATGRTASSKPSRRGPTRSRRAKG